MNLTAISYALQLMNALPGLIQAGRDVSAILSSGKAALEAMQAEKREPSPQEWDALNALIAPLRDELHGA